VAIGDFILCRRQHVKEIKDCKVLPLKAVAAQHKVLVVDSIFNIRRKKETKTNIPKTKWWKLKNPFLKLEFKRRVFQKLSADSEQDLWKKSAKIITQVGEKILGKTSGKGGPQDKETWWWSDEVKAAIKKKKDTKKKWDLSGRDEDKREYREANKESKKAERI
jgi:hypothetical protein